MTINYNGRGLLPALIRLVVMLTAPIWVFVGIILYILVNIVIVFPHWLWTGEDL